MNRQEQNRPDDKTLTTGSKIKDDRKPAAGAPGKKMDDSGCATDRGSCSTTKDKSSCS